MKKDAGELWEMIIKAGLKPPDTLTLMITDACNLSCPHCLLDCKGPGGKSVPGDIIAAIIDEFSALGGKRLLVTGGEPLLHPDWHDILSHACKTPCLSEVVLQTNGATVTGKEIKKLKLLDSAIFKIQVSLDGSRPETNDLIRGRGNFNNTLRAIKQLIEEGLGKGIDIAFTEMRHNYDEIPEMLKLADSLGVGRFIAGTLIKAGRAKNAGWISLPDRTQVRSLIGLYESKPEFRRLYDRIGCISAIEWYKGKDIPSDHVCNCINMPFINAKGNMYPCVMNLDNDLAVGSVHEEGFNAVIFKGVEKWAHLPVLDKERSESLEKCKRCTGREHCHGGCLGRAKAVNGDVMSVEDRCELRREVYYYGIR
ncbi:MAG: radical SAM protein [Deltaproteobacteria bacterium]|nr:radical SAM protein [Deltaproteobacteria bacterium]